MQIGERAEVKMNNNNRVIVAEGRFPKIEAKSYRLKMKE